MWRQLFSVSSEFEVLHASLVERAACCFRRTVQLKCSSLFKQELPTRGVAILQTVAPDSGAVSEPRDRKTMNLFVAVGVLVEMDLDLNYPL